MSEWKGIDVSKYQGTIEWNRVKTAGIEFAFVRLGYCGYDGEITVDPLFETNAKGAAAAGIEVGVYLYSYAKTPSAAKSAAEETVRLIEGYRIAYPVAFDMEDEIYRKLSKTVNTAIASAFLEEIEAEKYYAMLYSSSSFAEEFLHMDALRQYDFWVADYRGYVGYSGSYGIWQYSSTGRIDGIAVNVDLDTGYQDYGKIIREKGLNRLEDSTQPERWQILIYGFAERARADEVSDAFRILGYYNEVRTRDEKWQIVMYSFQERARAEEISKAITELGFYNEVHPLAV